MKIAHIADVHIRNLSRHVEYKEVFTDFVDKCRREQVEIIYIGGDIFHTKCSGMSPECIAFFNWFFRSLSSIAEVHFILGNHDFNVANLTRQDALSPIIDALNDPNVHFYKKSGIYEFRPGWNWCVYSLFDKETWETIRPVDGKINIACYHGGVRSSVTETGWPIEEGPSVDFFDDYHVVMLGDIHRQQYLGEYRGGKPRIAYPGTPVCQNYAEGPQPHGFLVWDMADSGVVNEVKFIELIQPHPFITIDWDGDIDSFKKNIDECASRSRFRVRSDVYMSQDEIKKVADILKYSKDAIEVVLKSDHVSTTKDIFTAGGLEMMRDDLRNIEVQMLLLRDFYQDLVISENEWQTMSELVTKYMRTATSQGDDDSPRHTKWSIDSIKFDNLFTYGKGNEINFSKLSGLVGIFGPNRCGKSSIPGALMYGLFNTTDRGSIKNLHVVNDRKGYGEAKVNITVDNTEYVITRETSKNDTRRGETFAATSLDIEKLQPDGSYLSLKGEQRTDTEKVIRKLIGTQDDFLLTSMSTQGDLSRFINEGSSFRKLILTKFLDLDIFEKMHNAAKKDVSLAEHSLRTLTERDWKEEMTALENSLKKHDEFIGKVEKKLESLREELHRLQVKIAIHQNVIPVSVDDVQTVVRRISDLEAALEKCEARVSNYESTIESLVSDTAKTSDELKSYDIDALVVEREKGYVLRQALKGLEHKLQLEEVALLEVTKSVKLLDVVPCGDQFPTCKFIKNSHIDKLKMPELIENFAKAKGDIEVAQHAIVEWDEMRVNDKITTHSLLVSKERTLVDNLSATKLAHSRITNELNEIVSSLATEKQRLVTLQAMLEKSENTELVELKASVVGVQNDIKKFDKMKLESAAGRGRADNELVKLTRDAHEWERLNREMRLHELVGNAFSKRGIPTRIINSQLPAINAAIREILHGVVDYGVELVADEESNAMDIFLNYSDSKRIIELGSGMEKMFAALAFRVALHTATSLPKTNTFIIDEGFGALDAVNVEACNRLLTSLKKYFKTVIVITHVDAVKDVADTVIEIMKVESDSKVVV